MRYIGCLFLFIAFSLSASSVQDDMVRELEFVRYCLSVKYAPAEWKKEHNQWDLQQEFEKAKARIFEENCTTAKDFQRVLRDFLASAQDRHVSTLFYSTELALSLLSVRGVEGRYFIQRTPKDANKLEIGDELLAIDKVPVSECIEKVIDENFGGIRTPTNYALAERLLFIKLGRFGDKIPKGEFSITVKHRKKGTIATYKLPWIYEEEMVANRFFPKKKSKFFERDYSLALASDLEKPFAKEQKLKKDSRRKSFVPELGKLLWETEKDDDLDLHAYLYQHPAGQQIGYLHLPSFSYDFPNALVDELKQIFKFFEEYSEALVIDINGNSGGSDLLMLGVLSFFADVPLIPIPEKRILIQQDVYWAVETMTDLEGIENEKIESELVFGYYVGKEELIGLREYCKGLVSTWESGKSMTDVLYLNGIDKVKPHPKVRYTKPILILTNELSVSAADFFPAILQDNGRATLFGSRTAGAGGCVIEYSYPSRFGVDKFTLTNSIAYRQNGDPIEDLGVTPDIPYEFTVRDLQENYPDYVQAVNQAVQVLTSQ